MKITLVISSLSSGGAERVMSIMANYWATKGWQVSLITLTGNGNDFYFIDPRVNRIGLDYQFPSNNALQAIYFNIKRLFLLRAAIKKSEPDVVISFMDRMNVMVLIATTGLKTTVLISERIDPGKHFIGKGWNTLRKLMYPFAHHLIVQSAVVLQWASDNWPRLSSSIIVNPVFVSVNNGAQVLDQNFQWCIAMGRLTNQKGFDLLLSAFAQAKSNDLLDKWRLVILGEGEQRQMLEQKITRLGLTREVIMPGRVKNPEDYLNQADMFILSSRFEGFPNALLEAMACGLPVIATNCPSGPAEIINQNLDGILVEPESSTALALVMLELMRDIAMRERLGNFARKSVSRFSTDNIMQQWESIIYEEINDRT